MSSAHSIFIALLLLALVHNHLPHFADAQSEHDSCILSCTQAQRDCVTPCSSSAGDRDQQRSCFGKCEIALPRCFRACDRNSPCRENIRRCEFLACNRNCIQDPSLADGTPELTECYTGCSEKWIGCMTTGCIGLGSDETGELVKLNYEQ